MAVVIMSRRAIFDGSVFSVMATPLMKIKSRRGMRTTMVSTKSAPKLSRLFCASLVKVLRRRRCNTRLEIGTQIF